MRMYERVTELIIQIRFSADFSPVNVLIYCKKKKRKSDNAIYQSPLYYLDITHFHRISASPICWKSCAHSFRNPPHLLYLFNIYDMNFLCVSPAYGYRNEAISIYNKTKISASKRLQIYFTNSSQ